MFYYLPNLKKTHFNIANLLFIFFFFATQYSFTQQYSWVNIPSQKVKACDTTILPFQIVKSNGGSFSSEELRFSLQLPNWVGLIEATGSGLSNEQKTKHQISVSASSNHDTVSVYLKVVANCESFNLSQNLNFDVTASVQLIQSSGNNNAVPSFIRNLVIERGVLSYKRIVNQSATTDLFGKVERCYIFTNTSASDSLSIDLIFRDSILYQLKENWVKLQSISAINSPYFQVTNSYISDTLVTLSLSLDQLPPGDSIVICDSIQLLRCPTTGTDHTLTEFSLQYGCPTDTMCQLISYPQAYVCSLKISDKSPSFEITRLTTERTCPIDSNRYSYRIKNGGTGLASGATFTWSYLFIDNTLSSIDTNSIRFYTLDPSTGNKTILPYIKQIESKIVDVTVHTETVVYNIALDRIFQPNGSFYLEYREFEHCPDTMDTEELLKYPNIKMYNHTLAGRFDHPCKPSKGTFQEHTREQSFYLNQYSDNLIAMMDDGQEEWFEIKNNGWLNIFNIYSPHSLYYDLEKSRLSIDIAIDSGFCFSHKDSLYLQSSAGDILRPYQAMHIAGENSAGIPEYCTKDTLRAYFKLPLSFFKIGSGGKASQPNEYYDQFFKNFKVRFKMKANCNYVNFEDKTKPYFEQTVYFEMDTLCDSICRIPLERVREDIQINCPNCLVPGWNLSSFDIERLNIGGSDTNNNHFPDVLPTNPTAKRADVETKRIIIGDTIAFRISANVSNGSPSLGGYLVTDVDRPYQFGVLFLDTNVLLPQMEVLDVRLNFRSSINNINYNVLLDQSVLGKAGVQYRTPQGRVYMLSLDSSNWVDHYGLKSFTNYREGDSIDIELRYVVTENLSRDPLIGLINRYEVNAFIFMSGTAFDYANLRQKTDALNVEVSDLAAMSKADKKALNHWCTASEGRVLGYGLSAQHNFEYKGAESISICSSKKLSYTLNGSVGRSWIHFNRDQVPAALETFPNEIRDLWMLNNVRMKLPSNYTVSKAGLHLQTLREQTQTNKTTIKSGSTARIPSRSINYSINGGYIDFDLTNLQIPPITEPWRKVNGSIDPDRNLSFFDESKLYVLNVYLDPVDCKDTTTGIEKLSIDVQIDGNRIPQETPPLANINFPLALWNPRFDMTATTFNFNGLADIEFNLNLKIKRIGSQEIPNVFFFMKSENGFIRIDGVNPGNNIVTQPFVRLASKLAGNKDYTYKIRADYDCSTVEGDDVIWLYAGYSCDGPVTSFADNICRMDSIPIIIPEQTPGMQANHSFPAVFELCDTNWHQATINAVGNQLVENVNLIVNLPYGVQIPSLNGLTKSTLRMEYGVNSYFIEGNPLGGNSWHFSLGNSLNNFVGTRSITASIFIPYLIDCDFNLNEDFTFRFTSEDYCGKDLQQVEDIFKPSLINGNYDFTQLHLTQFTADLTGTCEDDINFTTTIRNTSIEPSESFVVKYYCSSINSSPLVTACSIGNSAAIQLSGNASKSISTKLAASCGACESFYAVLEPVSTDCYCGVLADTLSNQVYCGTCEVNTDFTYSIKENCQLKLENLSTSPSPIVGTEWKVYDRNTNQLLKSSNDANPILTGLTAADLKVCLVLIAGSDSSCADTLCRAIDLCCVEDTTGECIIQSNFYVENDSCEARLIGNSTTSISTQVNYVWQVKAPNETIYTSYFTGLSNELNYQVSESGMYDVCLITLESANCADTVCKRVYLTRCPEPCELVSAINFSFNQENCSYELFISTIPNGVVTYNWSVSGPNINPALLPSSNASHITFIAEETGIHKVQLELNWIFDNDTCSKIINFEFNAWSCKKEPCEFDGVIELDNNECEFSAKLNQFPQAINLVYSWKLIDPTGNTVALSPGSSSPQVKFKTTQNGTYILRLFFSWSSCNELCEKEYKIEFEGVVCEKESCDLEGNVKVNFSEETCMYEVAYSGQQVNNYVFNWVINASNQLAPIALNPNASATAVRFNVQNGISYVAKLYISWKEGEKECEKMIPVRLAKRECKSKCRVYPQFVEKPNMEKCYFQFVQSNTNGTTYKLWIVRDANNNEVYRTSNATLDWKATSSGTHSVQLIVYDSTKECKENYTLMIEVEDCKKKFKLWNWIKGIFNFFI